MILLDDFVGESMQHELDSFVSTTFDGSIDMHLSEDSNEVFLNNLWVDTKPSTSIFDDFPHETSYLKPIATPPPRASFASFAKVKKEQAKHAKHDVIVPSSSIRRDIVKNRRTKRKNNTNFETTTTRVPRGRRKSTSDDVDSKLREMEEQLKNLDPNSKEAKKQRRLIRNRMSAQLHRERKKMYVDQLEGELYHRDLEITRLKDQLEQLKVDNSRLKHELRTNRSSSNHLISPGVLDNCFMVPSSPELLTDAECDGESPRSSCTSSSEDEMLTLPSKNITMLLAVVFSVAFFGNGTQLLNELANGRDLAAYFKTKDLPQIMTMHETLSCLQGTVWENQEDFIVPEETTEVHAAKRLRMDPGMKTRSTVPRQSIHVVYGEEADVDDDFYGEPYSIDMLKSYEGPINHRLRQSPEVFRKIAMELKQLVGKKVSYLKFLVPTSAGTYEQVQCQVAE